MKLSPQLLARIALGTCAAATLAAVALHMVCLAHAGALWRDEAGGVGFATVQSIGGMCRNVALDSFPLFFHLLVRLWSAVGLGGSDLGLRVLGCLIGLSLLGAMWWNARLLGLSLPLVSLGLLATNVTLIFWGDSLRAYGCGCVFILLTLGLMWRLTQAPNRRHFLLATLAAVLSVQTLYQNAFLVLGACVAACAVSARRRQWKTVGLSLGVGLAAALSQVPYVPRLLAAQGWIGIAKLGFDFDRVGTNLLLALGEPLGWLAWAWVGLLPLAFAAGWAVLQEPARPGPVVKDDLPLFGVVALLSGLFLFFVFLRASELVTAPWYFLPLMAFGAGAIEAALGDWCQRFRVAAVAFVVVMIALPLPAALKSLQCRHTNIDLVATELRTQAKPGDLVLIIPFYHGISFNRYFKEPIAWSTLPPLDELRFYQGNVVTERLYSKELLQQVLAKVTATLSSGHTLWLVGEWPPAQPGEPEPPPLPEPPAQSERLALTESSDCAHIWQRQVVWLAATRAESAAAAPIVSPTPVSPVEQVQLVKVTGWRGEKSPQSREGERHSH